MSKPYYLLSQASVAPQGTDDKAIRKFSGVANSGKPFSHWGENTIVDMDGIQYQENMPILLLHDRGQRVGVGQLSVNDHQLIVKGTLLSNEQGKAIANEADEGFPWQMSAHIMPTSVEYVKEGKVTVNGQTLSAPISILRQCKVAEVSFTPTGVDDQTHATVLSDDGKKEATQSTQNGKETDMTLEEALAKIETLESEKKALEDENAELKANAKESKVDAELSQAGFSKDESGKWQGINESTVNLLLSASESDMKATVADLKASKPAADDIPPALLSEQHKGSGQSQGVQLSDNPLVANAMARSEGNGGFI